MSIKAIALSNSTCSGHGCFPPRNAISGSSHLFVTGIGVHRVGDLWSVHSCGNQAHPGTLAQGSSLLYSQGRPVGRFGDAVNCGSVVAVGSNFFFVNG